MKKSSVIAVSLLITWSTIGCCLASVEAVEPDLWNGGRADSNFGESEFDVAHGSIYYTAPNLESSSLTDYTIEPLTEESFWHLGTSPTEIAASVASERDFDLWNMAAKMSKNVKRLKEDMAKVQESPRLQLNKKAVESSLLDLEDRLELQVFQPLSKLYQGQSKYTVSISGSTMSVVDIAEKTLTEVTEAYTHLMEAVHQKIRAFRADTIQLKETAFNLWELVSSSQDDIVKLSQKAKRLSRRHFLSKSDLKMYLQFLAQQESVLRHEVIPVLQRFQPFNKPSVDFKAGSDDLALCRKTLSKVIGQLKEVANKLDVSKRQDKDDLGPVFIGDEGDVFSSKHSPAKSISKRSVSEGSQSGTTATASANTHTFLFVSFAVISGLFLAFAKIRSKRLTPTLPI